jgi:hypothetical protein
LLNCRFAAVQGAPVFPMILALTNFLVLENSTSGGRSTGSAFPINPQWFRGFSMISESQPDAVSGG